MNIKEQVKQAIDSYGMFHNPKKLEECASEIHTLYLQKVNEVIDKAAEFHKGALREGSEYYELHRAVISALNNIKAELEGENERD